MVLLGDTRDKDPAQHRSSVCSYEEMLPVRGEKEMVHTGDKHSGKLHPADLVSDIRRRAEDHGIQTFSGAGGGLHTIYHSF